METVVVRARIPSGLSRKRKLRTLPPPTQELRTSTDTTESKVEDIPRKRRRISPSPSLRHKLPWKPIKRPLGAGVENDGVMLMLEELEGFDISYDDEGSTEGKSKVRYTPHAPMKPTRSSASTVASSSKFNVMEDPIGFHSFDDVNNLPNWSKLPLLGSIKRALYNSSFSKPSEIQQETIPLALEGRDIVGIAETGSGKTLAFGLPIINYVLSQPPPSNKIRPLSALILAPTRELAMQVAGHLNSLASKLYGDLPKPDGPPRISVGVIVGGIDSHKQVRIIQRGMDIMVATPGRLWDLIESHENLKDAIRHIRFLVLDEADRMIETGHFAELENVLKLTSRSAQSVNQDDPEFENTAQGILPNQANLGMQTLIFSATMSKELQQNLRRKRKSAAKRKMNMTTTLDDLLLRLDLRDPEPMVVDRSPKDGKVSTLQESKVECITKDKDAYLYHFLLRYPGRTLVFLGSIDGIRRMVPILQHLQVDVIPLHSQLEQKQRMRNLEKFRDSSHAVLVATDIAARGLDIPCVDHVIHYQIPRSADVYVHRSGRTARASAAGFSLLLIGPDEKKTLRSLLASLHRRPEDIPDLNVDLDVLDKIKDRVSLARRLDSISHKQTKANHETNWLKQAAADLEIDLDPELVNETSVRSEQQEKAEATALKKRLSELIRQPIVAQGVMLSYVTSGSRPIIDDLVRGVGHTTMIGFRNDKADQRAVRSKG